MKGFRVVPILMLCLSFTGPAVGQTATIDGDWDCEARIDMRYPFSLSFQQADGTWTGTATSNAVESPLEEVLFDDTALSFLVSHPDAGRIEFEGRVDSEQISGDLGNYSFQGTFSCRRPAE